MNLATLQVPLTPKVGEVPADQEKYASWSGVHGYYQRPPTSSLAFKTDKMLSPTISTSDLILSRTVNSRMMSRNKSLVEYKGKNTGTSNASMSNSLRRSTSLDSFVYHNHFLKLISEKGSLDNFRNSFERYLKKHPFTPGDEVVSLYDIEAVVCDCLGGNVPDFVLYKFRELSISVAVHGELSWNNLCDVIEKVYQAVAAECAVHHELPPLMLLMTKPRIVDPKLGSLGDASTTFRDAFEGSNSINYNSQPGEFEYERPSEEIGANLNKSARILCAGTSKITNQLPGYKGHIPRNMRNTRKWEHAGGEEAHPVYNNLVLSQRGMGCVLGYTGYVPIETNLPRTERMTACDPRTSNGAAYGPIRAIL